MQVERTISVVSGGRVSNAWATCPKVWDNNAKALLIPDVIFEPLGLEMKGAIRFGMGPRLIS